MQNCHPLWLLNCVAKILLQHLFVSLNFPASFLTLPPRSPHKLFSVTPSLHFLNDIIKVLDDCKKVDSMCIYFRKAFDKLDQNVISTELSQFSVLDKLLKLLMIFYRTARIKWRGIIASHLGPSDTGVPKSSSLL